MRFHTAAVQVESQSGYIIFWPRAQWLAIFSPGGIEADLADE